MDILYVYLLSTLVPTKRLRGPVLENAVVGNIQVAFQTVEPASARDCGDALEAGLEARRVGDCTHGGASLSMAAH